MCEWVSVAEVGTVGSPREGLGDVDVALGLQGGL